MVPPALQQLHALHGALELEQAQLLSRHRGLRHDGGVDAGRACRDPRVVRHQHLGIGVGAAQGRWAARDGPISSPLFELMFVSFRGLVSSLTSLQVLRFGIIATDVFAHAGMPFEQRARHVWQLGFRKLKRCSVSNGRSGEV